MMLTDLYTCNYGYIGSRATGNGAGGYMIAGPNWKGETPEAVNKVFHCETEFCLVTYRTQLFGPSDMDNVKKVQAGYKVHTLSAFLNKAAPPAAPEIEWPKFDKKLTETDPFSYWQRRERLGGRRSIWGPSLLQRRLDAPGSRGDGRDLRQR